MALAECSLEAVEEEEVDTEVLLEFLLQVQERKQESRGRLVEELDSLAGGAHEAEQRSAVLRKLKRRTQGADRGLGLLRSRKHQRGGWDPRPGPGPGARAGAPLCGQALEDALWKARRGLRLRAPGHECGGRGGRQRWL